jgi:hypothetical protein
MLKDFTTIFISTVDDEGFYSKTYVMFRPSSYTHTHTHTHTHIYIKEELIRGESKIMMWHLIILTNVTIFIYFLSIKQCMIIID